MEAEMTSQKDFETFVEYCEEYRKAWGLFGWKIFYHHSELQDCYASTTVNLRDRTLRIDLSKSWSDEERPITDTTLKQTARHEMIHALLARMHALSYTRWAGDAEIDEAWEEAIRLIENVLDSQPTSEVLDGR